MSSNIRVPVMPEPLGLMCGVRYDSPKPGEFFGTLMASAPKDKCHLFTAEQLAARDAQWLESVLLLVNALRAADLWTDQEFDVADWRTNARAVLSAITKD
jgi:hypothetical protein